MRSPASGKRLYRFGTLVLAGLVVCGWVHAQSVEPLSVFPVSDETSVNRATFAAPGQPTWTHLTDFEQDLILRFKNPAAEPDSNDLLALFLIASGDIRDTEQLQPFQTQIVHFFEQHADLLRIRDEHERGTQLLSRMHRHFLHADERSPLAGYHADQSQLSELMRSGVYNCISSALLYLTLAEYAGLNSAGVIMPSHAYVQVTLADGRVIEVETTASNGFDVVRDEAFFARPASDWFETRGLDVPSFADYEKRRVISAAALGYESMWSQHTTELRMPYADRMRLAEIRGVLQSDFADAQHNRLVYYFREADHLRKQNDLPALDQLINRISPLLAAFDNRPVHTVFSDPISTVPALLLQAERADWLIRGGQTQQGQQLALHVLSQVDTAPMNNQLIRDLGWRALGTHVGNLIAAGTLDDARRVIDGFPDGCALSAFCINALEQFYISQGQQFWAQRNWPRAIAVYEEYLALDIQTDNRSVFETNLQTAYLNQAEQYWFDEERDEAVAMLEVCVIKVASAERCQARLQAARQSR
ncbi:hypothetical protein E3V39_11495 [Gammaproteobacteria bacterium LSUCC0112]|nr:hypothetical protein E3V39_11495 [Gammaproteobacteria bacterium LSUCC0112]